MPEELKPCNCGERDYCIGQASLLPGRVCKIAAFNTRLSDALLETIHSDSWIDRCVRDVAELPDRDSPEDWPEAMLVTGRELKTIIRERINDALDRLLPPSAPVCGTCGETKIVCVSTGRQWSECDCGHCERGLGNHKPCPDCSAPKEGSNAERNS